MSLSKNILITILKGAMALVIVLFSSCYREIPDKPIPLSEEKLILVLKDIHLAEALLTEIMNKQEKDSLARLYYAQIFRLHGVDTTEFGESMDAFTENPVLLDSIYSKVIELLNEERAAVSPDQAPPPPPNE